MDLSNKDVGEDFAKIEGEGDCALESWRRSHERYFKEECKRIGKLFTEEMPVICEEFEVIFR